MGNTQEALNVLVAATQGSWNELSTDLLNKLLDTLPHRVQAIFSAEGWYTMH